jgi:hypothetical protein
MVSRRIRHILYLGCVVFGRFAIEVIRMEAGGASSDASNRTCGIMVYFEAYTDDINVAFALERRRFVSRKGW